jgi:hypothetical protein
MKQFMNARTLWSHIAIPVGSIAMLVGALDPMEGPLQRKLAFQRQYAKNAPSLDRKLQEQEREVLLGVIVNRSRARTL